MTLNKTTKELVDNKFTSVIKWVYFSQVSRGNIFVNMFILADTLRKGYLSCFASDVRANESTSK